MPRQLKDPRLTVKQKSVTFNFYQFEFMAKHPEFKPDKFCREAIDAQIRIIDPDFWDEIESIKKGMEKNEKVD